MKLITAECKMPLRILMIGPLPPPFGGTRVSFNILLDLLEGRQDVKAKVIPLHHMRKSFFLVPGYLLSEVIKMFKWGRRVDVFALHCGLNVLNIRVPFALMIARIFKKPLLVRTFGGGGINESADLKKAAKLLKPLRNVHCYLAQTKVLVDAAKALGVARVEYFPTHRPMADIVVCEKSQNQRRRFVYIGHVRQYKGIQVLLDAFCDLPADLNVDVYGPNFPDFPLETFYGHSSVFYQRTLKPDEVVPILQEYDVLIMPTLARSEGYPGVILEAYQAGLPVIASRIGGIPEIVDDSCGILIEPGNVESLRQAVLSLSQDDGLYQRLKKGVLEKRHEFDAVRWADSFVCWCREIAGKC